MTKIFARVSHVPGLRSVARALSNRRGVAALEYGLVAALVAVVVIGAMSRFGTGLNDVMGDIGARLSSESNKITAASSPTK